MNQFAINKFSLKEFSSLLVYIAISLLAISDTGFQLLILTTIGPYSRTLRLTAFGLLLTKVILTRYTKKEFLIIAPIAALSLYNYTLCGNIYCIYNILVIACMKDIDFSKLFKVLFYSTFGSVILIGILSCLGIGSPVSLTQNFGRDIVETRYCFGLYHPNIWHFAITRCIVFFCIGYYERLNIIHILVMFVINYFVFLLSVSRTSMLAASLFLILIIFYKYLNTFMHFLLIKICAFVGMLGVYGLYLYMTYDFVVEYSLNSQLFDYRLTTGRIRQATTFLAENPVQLLGSRFPDDGSLFDCGLLRVFYESGYLLAGLFFAALFLLVIIALKNHWDIIIPTTVYFIFYSLYEIDPVTRPTFNVVVFFFALLLFGSSQKTKNQLCAPFSWSKHRQRSQHS